jgi:hypothetical protein
MELHISEIQSNNDFEKIPENMPTSKVPIKVIKKNVHFDEPLLATPQQTIKPSLSGVKARMVRPQIPDPKPKLSYDDILAKMGMFVADGQLHLLDGKPQKQIQQIQQQSQRQPIVSQKQPIVNPDPIPIPNQQNSYIFNKYFNNESNDEPVVRTPQTIQEYRDMLISDIIQKHKNKQIKSTKLIMPTSNINFSQGRSGNLNKLFTFSQR